LPQAMMFMAGITYPAPAAAARSHASDRPVPSVGV
jgi:hypothetical protein